MLGLVLLSLFVGATDMFSSKADFSGISGKRDLFISDAIHKAMLEVREGVTKIFASSRHWPTSRPAPDPLLTIDHLNV